MREKFELQSKGEQEIEIKEMEEISIEDVIDKNINNEVFLKAIFSTAPEKINKQTFISALEKLRQAETGISAEEKEMLFRGALEYFSAKKEISFPLGHATGSESLRMIIEDGKIKAGGSGETGEGAGYLRSLQESVSVAEMDNPTAIYLELEYAVASANRELTKELLKIDADAIDKTTLFEDYILIRVTANPELALRVAGERLGIDRDKLQQEIAKDNNVKVKDITPKMIIENQRIKALLQSEIENAADKKHYKTLEGEKMNFEALTRIMKDCDRGILSSCEYKGKTLSDPEEILKIDRPAEMPSTVEEKVFIELHDQYNYYFNNYEGKDGKPLTVEDFIKDKERYLAEVKDWLKQSQYDRLLYPLPEDSEQKKLEKLERLEVLDNQYPAIIIMEGQEFVDNQQTYSSIHNGERPLEILPAEDRIMNDVPVETFREILVPDEKIPEVRALLDEKQLKWVNVMPIEYFEIKRMIEH